MPSLVVLAIAAWAVIPTLGHGEEVAIRRVQRIVYGPSPAEHFRNPRGLIVDREHGIIAVGDTGNHRLAFFDSLGRYRGAMSWRQDEWGQLLKQPRSVAVDTRGRFFALDAAGHEIEVLSATGARVGRFVLPLPDGFTDERAVAIEVGASGRIYALLSGTRAGIAVIEPNGRVARVIEFAQVGAETFSNPAAFAVHPDESRIAVLDQPATQQVKILSMEGTLLYDFGPHAEGPGSFAMAYSATWGPQGSLWVVDTIRHTINVFDADATYIGRIGGFGHGAGQLNYPAACAFLSDRELVVLERSGNRFQILSLRLQLLEHSRTSLGTSGSETWSQHFPL